MKEDVRLHANRAPLVVTPRPSSRETAIGYALRLTEANGYTSPAIFLPDEESFAEARVWRGGRADALARLACLDEAAARRLEIGGTGHAYRLLGHAIRAADVSIYHHRICPTCIANDGIYDASWHLRLITHCPIHRDRLTSTCSRCGHGLRINRQGPGRCKCGAVVEASPDVDRCSSDTAGLFQAIRSRLLNDERVAPFPKHFAVLEGVGLPSFLTLLWRLRKYTRGEWLDCKRVTYQDDDAALEVISRAFQSWDQGIRVFNSILMDTENRDDIDPSPRGYRWYFKGAPSLALIADLDFIGQAIAKDADNGGRFGRSRSDLDRFDDLGEWIDSDRISEVASCDVERIAQLIDLKLVRRTVKKVVGCSRHIVLKSEIEALRLSSFEGMHFEEAAKITGMQVPLFKRLARSSAYQVKHVAATGGPLAREDVEEFAMRLDKLGDMPLSPRGTLTLRRAVEIKAPYQINYSAMIGRLMKSYSSL